MFKKLEYNLKIKRVRNFKLTTPCCGKSNSDGKFVNFKELPESYGYCHSCGKTTLPPTRYKDDKGNMYTYNSTTNKFDSYLGELPEVILNSDEFLVKPDIKPQQKFISDDIVAKFTNNPIENNLLSYFRSKYPEEKVDKAKRDYFIGTSKDGCAVFWCKNITNKAQKAKVVFYDVNGKRTGGIRAPYKKDDGFYSCLYGEHLINLLENRGKPIALVESEKTAIVCSMFLPNYVWLSYGGINGLTNRIADALVGRKVVIVPDMSENAVAIMRKKLPFLIDLNIEAELWDMTNGKTDEELKEEGWYNCDLEDFFRYFL